MKITFALSWPQNLVWVLGWTLASAAAQGQTTPSSSPPEPASWTLRAVFEHAWQRQPEAQTPSLHQHAAQAARSAAQRWSAAPPSLEVHTRTDKPGSQQGLREVEIGLVLPLWLPGERQRSAALADAQWQWVQEQQRVAQWQLAGQVRQAWWDWQRARSDFALAQERLRSAQQLADDVRRRFEAGDLARTDWLQAQAVVTQAQGAQAQTQGAYQAARAALAVWWTWPPEAINSTTAAPPLHGAIAAQHALSEQHPALVHSQAQVQLARSSADLAAVQRRANPEISVATTHGRDQTGERYRKSVTLGLRVALGSNDMAQAKEALARAAALEADIRYQRERERLTQDIEAAQARAVAAQAHSEAASRYAALAQETVTHIDKAFRLGAADWPTRLRAEQEFVQAQHQWARTRIDAAAAISALHQSLGLLPE